MNKSLLLGLLVVSLLLGFSFPSFAAGSNSNIGEAALYLGEKLPYPEIKLEANRVAFLAFMKEEPARSWEIWKKHLKESLIQAAYQELDENEKAVYDHFKPDFMRLIDQMMAAMIAAGTNQPEGVKQLVAMLPKDPEKVEGELTKLLQDIEGLNVQIFDEDDDPDALLCTGLAVMEMFFGTAWFNYGELGRAEAFLKDCLANAERSGEWEFEFSFLTMVKCPAEIFWPEMAKGCSKRLNFLLEGRAEEEGQDFIEFQEIVDYYLQLYKLGVVSVTKVEDIKGLARGKLEPGQLQFKKRPENLPAVREFAQKTLEFALSPSLPKKGAALRSLPLFKIYGLEEAKTLLEIFLESLGEERPEELMVATIVVTKSVDKDLFFQQFTKYVWRKLRERPQGFLAKNPQESVRLLLFALARNAETGEYLDVDTTGWLEGQIKETVALQGDRASLLQLLSLIGPPVESERLTQEVEEILQDFVEHSQEAGKLAGVLVSQTAPFNAEETHRLIDILTTTNEWWTNEDIAAATVEILESLTESLSGIASQPGVDGLGF